MAITGLSIWNNVKDDASPGENGSLSTSQFNRRADMVGSWLISFFTGGVTGLKPPTQYVTQKNKDFIQHLIVPDYTQIVGANGRMPKPSNYYTYETMYALGSQDDVIGCESGDSITGKNTPIEILDSPQFDARTNTYIDELKPSLEEPICKIVGDYFYFFPKQLGQVNLEYIKYPTAGQVQSTIDQVTMDEVVTNVSDFECPGNTN